MSKAKFLWLHDRSVGVNRWGLVGFRICMKPNPLTLHSRHAQMHAYTMRRILAKGRIRGYSARAALNKFNCLHDQLSLKWR